MWCKIVVQFHSLHVVVRSSQHHLMNKQFFSHVYSCLLHCRLIDHTYLDLFWGSLFCSIDLYVCFMPVQNCFKIALYWLLLLPFQFECLFFLLNFFYHIQYYVEYKWQQWAFCLFLIFKQKLSVFDCWVYISCGFVIMAFMILRYIPFITHKCF